MALPPIRKDRGLSELVAKCAAWSWDRKIIQNSNKSVQCLKLVSEVGELADNIAKGRDVEDDIGDCLVVLNNLALMHNTTPVSYTHLTLPTYAVCRSRWSPYH